MPHKILCATTNQQKFELGEHILASHGIRLIQQVLDIDEIQAEDPEVIISDKVTKAYAAVHQPVIVSDDSWDIPALSGFPGAYMKSINHWFEPHDFIALMAGKTDRSIMIHAYLAYYDGAELVIVHSDHMGEIIYESRGQFGPPIMHVTAMACDGGQTISEMYDAGKAHDDAHLSDRGDAWNQMAKWLKDHTS